MKSRFGLHLGDNVRHIEKGWIGTVVGFMKRNAGVLVDLSDERGVEVKWIHHKKLEKINESR
tara:strand:+ start:2123 stop:2308 length:186 start_codon:yes stop_codon:yes gene_type:complete